MTNQEIQQEALLRARGSQALSNFPAIFSGFAAKGIPEDQIEPRVNIFTYQAWRALGRQVRKGEHGVRVSTWVPMSKDTQDEDTGKTKTETFRRPKMATVFHISQTDERG